jgi:putative transposase
MGIDVKLIDELLKGGHTLEVIAGEGGLLKQLTKAILERALAAELSTHLGYEKHEAAGRGTGNSRNGASKKRLKGDFGALEIEVPRDRASSFEPLLLPKGQTRWHGFDDKILSLYARGMTTREIQGHLEEMYQVEVSPTLISNVTDAVLDEVRAWQSRPLDEVYAIVYLDALMVKMRSEGRVENRAVYVAIGVTLEGGKEVLGLWTSAHEGAKFWLQVLTELRNRGVQDIFIACVDGLKGFPAAIETVFPKTTVQLCIVHMVRASLNFVNWKQRQEVAGDLKTIYRAATEQEAEQKLKDFSEKWERKYPTIAALWRRNWQGIVPFFQFPAEVRRIVYTTNAIESLNMSLRKAIKTRGAFPSEDAAMKVMYLALRNLAAKWHSIQGWKEALNQFIVLWQDRFPQHHQARNQQP